MTTEILKEKSRLKADCEIPYIAVAETEHLTMRAKATLSMLDRWGMVAAEDGGEDSAGRHKLALPETSVLVKRAIDIVDEAFNEFGKRGWIVELPTVASVKQEFEKKKEPA